MLEAETAIPQLDGVGVGVVLVVSGAFGLWPAIAVARRVVGRATPSRARWGLVQLGAVLCVGLVVSLALPFVWPFPEEGSMSQIEAFSRMGILFLVTGGAIAAVSLAPGAGGLAALGLRWGGNLRGVLMSTAVYLLLLPALLGITALWTRALEAIDGEVEPQEVLVGFLGLDGASLALALVLGIVVLPFFEELIFRGFVQPVLVRLLGGVAGVGLTSGLFAMLHGLIACVPVFALSLVLGAVMLRTQRLTSCWFVHSLHNGLMILVLLVQSESSETAAIFP